MRAATLTLLAIALAALMLGGCGGGSSLAPAPDAFVSGKVVSVDGSTADLGGIEVATIDGSAKATTDATGAFHLGVRSGATLRLRFDDPNHASEESDDVEEGDDDTPDGSDIDGDEIEIEGIEEGETCEMEIELENGEIVEAWIRRNREDGQHFEAEARLVPPEDAANQDARGEVEIECAENCCSAEIEVAGLIGPDIIEIVLWHPDGAEFSLGVFEVDAEGTGHWEAEACVETPGEGGGGEGGGGEVVKGEACEVPFGADNLDGLKGVRLLLVDGLGTVVLVGEMPGNGAQHDDEDHCYALTALTAPDGSNEPSAFGIALLKEIDECHLLVIEVGEFDSSPLLKAYVENADGVEALLGSFEVTDKGMGRFVHDACPGDELPFGVDTLAGLSGMKLLVTNGDGVLMLQGEFPTIVPCDDDDDGEEPWRAADGALTAPDLSPEPDAEGWILAKVKSDACFLVIEVGGIAQTEILHVVIVAEGGDEALLGEFEIDAEGGGRFATDDCEALPFEAANLDDLGGYRVELVDGEGRVVLAGVVPTIPE